MFLLRILYSYLVTFSPSSRSRPLVTSMTTIFLHRTLSWVASISSARENSSSPESHPSSAFEAYIVLGSFASRGGFLGTNTEVVCHCFPPNYLFWVLSLVTRASICRLCLLDTSKRNVQNDTVWSCLKYFSVFWCLWSHYYYNIDYIVQ